MINVLAKTDRALVNYLISQGVGTAENIYPFKRSLDKALPCIICHSTRAINIIPFDGTVEVEAAIYIRTLATLDVAETDEEKVSASDDLVENAMDALNRFGDGAQGGGDLADEITAAGGSGFVCDDVSVESVECNVDFARQSEAWTDIVNLRLVVRS